MDVSSARKEYGRSSLMAFLAPIQGVLRDPKTTEVVVNRPGEVGVQQNGQWFWMAAPDLTAERLDAIGILAGFAMGKELSDEFPLLGSTLPEGHRIQVCRPPVTRNNIVSLTIRKPAEFARTVDDDDFTNLFGSTNIPKAAKNDADQELIRLYKKRDWRRFFKLARRSRKTMACTGSTGSGKTDILKRFIQLTPPDFRIITIEDQPEFGELGPRNKVNLFYGNTKETVPEKVLEAALRMLPYEIWMQEIRGAESWSFLRALAAGHKGGCTSWHADEGRSLEALMLMVRQHPATAVLSDEVLEKHLKSYLDVILWCERVDDSFSVPRLWFKAAEEAGLAEISE